MKFGDEDGCIKNIVGEVVVYSIIRCHTRCNNFRKMFGPNKDNSFCRQTKKEMNEVCIFSVHIIIFLQKKTFKNNYISNLLFYKNIEFFLLSIMRFLLKK